MQAAGPVQPAPDFAYRQAVEQYRASPDDGVSRMLGMPDADVERGIRQAVRDDSGWDPIDLNAAVLMHTEAALSLYRAHSEGAWPQLAHAEAVALARRDLEDTWFLFRWYRFLTFGFNDARDIRIESIGNRLMHATWFPVMEALDAGLYTERQAIGLPAALDRPAVDQPTFAPSLLDRAIPSFKAAVLHQVYIAAVHLGRIQMLRGQDAEARRLFEEAVQGTRSRTTRYLAHLFLGAFDEREGHPDAAERHYRAALDAVPRAQSGEIALASLLARSGRAAEAQAAMTTTRSRPSGRPPFDPWWTYLPGNPRDSALFLAALRAEVLY